MIYSKKYNQIWLIFNQSHQHYYPLHKIQILSKPKTLFDTLFVFENYPVDENSLNESSDDIGFTIEDYKGIESNEYHISLMSYLVEQKLIIKLYFQDNLFN